MSKGVDFCAICTHYISFLLLKNDKLCSIIGLYWTVSCHFYPQLQLNRQLKGDFYGYVFRKKK